MLKVQEALKAAFGLKRRMDQLSEELKRVRVEAEAGGGLVRAVMDGEQNLVELKLDPELVASGDLKLIEDLIVSAVNEARRRALSVAEEKMQGLMRDLPAFLKDVGAQES